MTGSECDGEDMRKKLNSGRDLNGRNTRERQKATETALMDSAAEILKKNFVNKTKNYWTLAAGGSIAVTS